MHDRRGRHRLCAQQIDCSQQQWRWRSLLCCVANAFYMTCLCLVFCMGRTKSVIQTRARAWPHLFSKWKWRARRMMAIGLASDRWPFVEHRFRRTLISPNNSCWFPQCFHSEILFGTWWLMRRATRGRDKQQNAHTHTPSYSPRVVCMKARAQERERKRDETESESARARKKNTHKQEPPVTKVNVRPYVVCSFVMYALCCMFGWPQLFDALPCSALQFACHYTVDTAAVRLCALACLLLCIENLPAALLASKSVVSIFSNRFLCDFIRVSPPRCSTICPRPISEYFRIGRPGISGRPVAGFHWFLMTVVEKYM